MSSSRARFPQGDLQKEFNRIKGSSSTRSSESLDRPPKQEAVIENLAQVHSEKHRSLWNDLKVQTLVLTKKNFLIQTRSTTAFATQLFIGVIFLALLRLMQVSITSNPAFLLDYTKVDTPPILDILPPKRCYPSVLGGGCFGFVVAPNDNSPVGIFASAVAAQMAKDAGFPGQGQPYGYELFSSESAIDSWLFENQNRTPVAVIFKSSPSDGKIAYTLQYNQTKNCGLFGVLECNNPTVQFMSAYENLIDQAIIRFKTGKQSASITVREPFHRSY